MNEWAEYTLKIANDIFKSKGLGSEKEKEFNEIVNYCKGRTHDIITEDGVDTKPTYLFSYDIKKWLASDDSPLYDFRFDKPTWIEFRFSKEHYQVLKDHLDEYGDNRMGRSKFVKYVAIDDLWRHPFFKK